MSSFQPTFSLFLFFAFASFLHANDETIYLMNEKEKSQTGSEKDKIKENYLTGKAGSKMISWTEKDRKHQFRPDAKKAFDEMIKAYYEDRKNNPEYKDGPDIKSVSAFRGYSDQLGIWNAKYNGERLMKKIPKEKILEMSPEERVKLILEYSSAPGTSRHHWGTDIDINSLDNSYFESGKGQILYKWLKKNAHEFGFCQPYTSFEEQSQEGFFQGRKVLSPENGNIKGYFKENWHWSYAPVSQKLVEDWVELYEKKNKDPKSILGNIGGVQAISSDIPLIYVTAVNKGCDEVRKHFEKKKDEADKSDPEDLKQENVSFLSGLWKTIIDFFKGLL